MSQNVSSACYFFYYYYCSYYYLTSRDLSLLRLKIVSYQSLLTFFDTSEGRVLHFKSAENLNYQSLHNSRVYST